MKVLSLVPHRMGFAPGQRSSIELWEEVLQLEGISLHFEPFETERLRGILHKRGNRLEKVSEMLRGYTNRIKLLRELDEYDAVVVYREAALLGPAFLENMIAKKKPIIYILDDPLFMPYRSPSNGYLSYLKFFGKIKSIIEMSRVVIVNSTQIRDYALQFNHNVFQIPSIVDTRKFSYIPKGDDCKKVCIGWSGSPTTLGNLKMVESPLRRIGARSDCSIKFIGGSVIPVSGFEFAAQPWCAETEVEDLRALDIGLVPLPENRWNPYKFLMKTAQYMALGIVPIGTPMASNPEVIRHGENGFLASNDEEWFSFMKLLVEDKELQRRMSTEAAEDARKRYSLEANAQKIITSFKSAIMDGIS
jgi:glycosyltransferase involved in cell wall biosynthesis